MADRWMHVAGASLRQHHGDDLMAGQMFRTEAEVIIDAVLADLRRQILDMPSHVWVNGTDSYRAVTLNRLLNLLDTGGSDE